MPIFHSRREPSPVQPVVEEPVAKKHSIFHSRRDPSPARTTSTTSSSGYSGGGGHLNDLRSKRGSFFRRGGGGGGHDDGAVLAPHERDARHHHELPQQRNPSLLHKSLNKMGVGSSGEDRDLDPSILRAREHVMSAEAAEAEADRALDEAKRRVKEARAHVRRLEEEAEEDARRARIKQHHAAEVSKRGKVLGRKYYSRVVMAAGGDANARDRSWSVTSRTCWGYHAIAFGVVDDCRLRDRVLQGHVSQDRLWPFVLCFLFSRK
ncbi:hypothetical protein PWT90_08184 [Aphanocladium album]|nr:hypothetical protein PWT90_08184 [Aphanocladium album]